ncbi:unnamed protein product [Urochloa humidicola]
MWLSGSLPVQLHQACAADPPQRELRCSKSWGRNRKGPCVPVAAASSHGGHTPIHLLVCLTFVASGHSKRRIWRTELPLQRRAMKGGVKHRLRAQRAERWSLFPSPAFGDGRAAA